MPPPPSGLFPGADPLHHAPQRSRRLTVSTTCLVAGGAPSVVRPAAHRRQRSMMIGTALLFFSFGRPLSSYRRHASFSAPSTAAPPWIRTMFPPSFWLPPRGTETTSLFLASWWPRHDSSRRLFRARADIPALSTLSCAVSCAPTRKDSRLLALDPD
jgi:hypothetical protein